MMHRCCTTFGLTISLCLVASVAFSGEGDGEIRRLRAPAERAEALVAVQKKLSEILGIELPTTNGK